MENGKVLTLRLRLTRRKAIFSLAAFFLCWRPGSLNSETLTLTTYYPAPYGGYATLLTTGQTLLAREGGLVGVGTNSPSAKLHVKGSFLLDDGTQGAGKILTSDADGAATWQLPGGGLPNCNNAGTPENSTNKPCYAALYRCPVSYTANGVSAGAWASYGCVGQLWAYSTCLVVVSPQSEYHACTSVGKTPIY
ncbi:MAG: hypothetical protein A2X28_02940 [Elusimicrobia bacterium GWA2_56_46]|jgi:hypothetical protein|nr:MAG: hypothetical protein A2X28_02940 [Elusimicrobia bacterium GWA2_56_46]OGR54185.1 MAG: hypothetical protein A2X39_08885 [Elusimicrobia bacterium GWC2_56_31]HBB68253.1 hypothetical protein [Elusimicrobiota bacterium]HBW21762.1 hypothetical protein [Elusimicrobiota bacterium]